MIPVNPDTVIWTFLYFCRIGACIMVIPGFSSRRIPLQVRLFFAIAITLVLTPLLLPEADKYSLGNSTVILVVKILAELLKGLLIGFMGLMFMLSLQFAASAMAMFIGMGSLPGTPIEEAEPVPSLVSLITMTATVLIFATDLHVEVIRALLSSYQVSPAGELPVMRLQLVEITDKAATAMMLAIQIASPFLIYAVIANFAIGLMNKLTPQIPIYFISLPVIVFGGLLLLFFVSDEILTEFMRGFSGWLENG